MLYIDTNYLIRFITNDIPNLALTAKKVIINDEIFVSTIMVTETVYILRKFYGVEKEDVCDKLATLLRQKNICSSAYILSAIEIYKRENISFYDSLLVSEVLKNNGELGTFDKKLQKVFKKYSN